MDWILDVLTQLGTTSNYSATANLHTLKITSANTKSSANGSGNSHFLVADVNSGDSSASRTQVLPARWISRNWNLSLNSLITPSLFSLPCRAQLNCQLSALSSSLSWPGPGADLRENTASNCSSIVLGTSTVPLPRNWRLLIVYCIATAILVVCFDVFTQ
jgi:hypothetical protein